MKRSLLILAAAGMLTTASYANNIVTWMSSTFTDNAGFFNETISGSDPRGIRQFTMNIQVSLVDPGQIIDTRMCGNVVCYTKTVFNINHAVTGTLTNLRTHTTRTFIDLDSVEDEDGGAVFEDWFAPLPKAFSHHYAYDFEGSWGTGQEEWITEVNAFYNNADPPPFQDSRIQMTTISPEPSTLLMIGSGLIGIGLQLKRNLKQR